MGSPSLSLGRHPLGSSARSRAWWRAPARQAPAPAGPWEVAVTLRRLSLAVASEQLGTGLQDELVPGSEGLLLGLRSPQRLARPLSAPHCSAFLREPPNCFMGLWADGGRQGASGGGPGRGGRPPALGRALCVCSRLLGASVLPWPPLPHSVSLCVSPSPIRTLVILHSSQP